MVGRKTADAKYLAELLPNYHDANKASSTDKAGPHLEEAADLEKIQFYLSLGVETDPAKISYLHQYLAWARSQPGAKVSYFGMGRTSCPPT